MSTSLLIIDVQRVLCSGTFKVFESQRVIDRINHVARLARAAASLVVVIQHETKDGVMDYGTDNWQLAEGLEVFPEDTYVRKTASDSFHKTNLEEILRARGVSRLIICGLQSEFCVDTSTRRALALGYPVVLVADGHSTLDNSVLSAAQISAHHNETLANLTSFSVRLKAIAASEVRIDD